jgi:ribosomal protein L37E
MTDEEARFIMHAVGGDPLIASYLDNQARAGYDMRQMVGTLPVCPRCERAALHAQQGIICPSCGYKGASLHKIREHMMRGFNR